MFDRLIAMEAVAAVSMAAEETVSWAVANIVVGGYDLLGLIIANQPIHSVLRELLTANETRKTVSKLVPRSLGDGCL